MQLQAENEFQLQINSALLVSSQVLGSLRSGRNIAVTAIVHHRPLDAMLNHITMHVSMMVTPIFAHTDDRGLLLPTS